jgi:photosystem II stability/assembly factor-like uncharacterized protein
MKNLYLLVIFCMLVQVVNSQPVFNWTSQEIKAGNNLQKMTVSNNQAVVDGYGRTFVKSTDNGSTWKDLGVLSTQFDFNNMSFKGINGLIAGNRSKLFDAFPDPYTNGIILQTSDAGYTWKNLRLEGLGQLEDIPGWDPALSPAANKCYGLDFQMVGCASDMVAYCALRWMEYKADTATGFREHSGIFVTFDKGVAWKNISGDLKGAVITAFASYDTTCYIGGNKKLYRTSRNSEILIDIFNNLNAGATAYVNDIQAVSKDEIYVITTTNGAFKSVNGGDTFTKYNITGITGGQDLLKVDDNTLILTGSSGKSRVSRDAGITWEDAKLAVAIWEVGGVLGDSLYVLAKSDVYKIKVTDLTSGNYTWVKQTVSPDNNLHKMHVFDSDNAILIGLGQTFKKTGDKGKTWTDVPLPAVPTYDASLDFNGLRNIKDTAYACLNRFYFVDYTSPLNDIYWSGGICKTTDNWTTYSSLDAALIGAAEGTDASKNPQLGICNGFNPTVIEYAGNNVVLVWARWYDVSGITTKVEHSRVFRSADAGKSWKVVSDDFGGSNYVMDIKFNGNTGYVAGNKILLKSTDKGSTFTDIYPALKSVAGTDQFINAITLRPGNEFFVTTTTAVFRSADGGTSFTKLGTTTGGNDMYAFNNSGWIVLGTTSKSLFTNDAGSSWLACSAGATIYECGGVWNENFYALGQGKLYRMPVSGLNLTSAQNLSKPGELSVIYKPLSVELVSGEQLINRCLVYSVSGQVITDFTPFSNRVELQNHQFKPGLYIVRSQVGNSTFVNKIVVR